MILKKKPTEFIWESTGLHQLQLSIVTWVGHRVVSGIKYMYDLIFEQSCES